jgi:LysM repeat protein
MEALFVNVIISQNWNKQMKRILLLTALVVLTTIFFINIFPVQAEQFPPQVVYSTPTPNAEGRIIFVVRAGDSCNSISFLTGVPLDELRRLNNLKEDCALLEGQQLLIGIAAKPAQEATPTPLNQVPTPTMPPGSGDVCVLLFTDINGNSIPDGNEVPLAGGAISITDRDGKMSLTNPTSATEPVCFPNIAEGEYNISVAVPEGYNPTTVLNYPLKLRGGDKSTLDFGAQPGSKIVEPSPIDGGKSPLLGIIGAVLIIGGAGLGFYVMRVGRKY